MADMNHNHVPCQSRARIASSRERDNIWEVRGEEVGGEEVRGRRRERGERRRGRRGGGGGGEN